MLHTYKKYARANDEVGELPRFVWQDMGDGKRSSAKFVLSLGTLAVDVSAFSKMDQYSRM
jgi:hypothetical protein